MNLFDVLRADGKAIPDHQFFHSSAPITTYIPGGNKAGREKPVLSQREAKRHLDAYGGTQAVDWLYDAVNLYAEAASLAPWHFENKDGDTFFSPTAHNRPPGAKIADVRAARLLDQPNPFMDYSELIQLLVIDLFLVGNAYWLRWRPDSTGKPLALYRMSPLHVKVKPGIYGVEGYTYQPEGVSDPIEFGVEDVIHFKRPNPHSPYYGLGVIKGGGRPFDLELAVTDSTASYFENKADPSLIVQSERRVPRDVFNKLRGQLRARVAEPSKSGELLVLEAGLKASTLTPNARDAMYAEISDKSRDRILAMLHVHPALLGLPGTTTGSDKVQDLRRDFVNNSIKPFIDRLQKLISDQVAQAWDYTFHIDYRYTMAQEDVTKLAGDFASVPGVKVIDVRRFLVEGGLLREASTGDPSIDETVLNLPGAPLGPDGQPLDPTQGGFADKNLPGEAGRPPKGNNTKAFPKAGQKMPAGTTARRPGGKALTMDEIVARMGELEHKAVTTSIGRRLKDEQRPEDTMKSARDLDIDALTAAMTQELADAAMPLERALLDHAEGKASGTVRQRIRNSEAWKTFQSTIAGIMERYAQQGLSSAAVHSGSTEGIDYEGVARELVYRKDGVRAITKTLKDEIAQKVGAALDSGADRQQLETAIRESISFWRETKAETIALTEAVHAYNEGTLLSLEADGATEVYVEDGNDHDEPCIEANGSVWPIEYARDHRLEHPRCRRAFLPLVEVPS